MHPRWIRTRDYLRSVRFRPRMRASLIVVAGNLIGAGAAFAAAIVAARVLALDQFAAFGVGLAVNSLAVQFADFGLGTIAIAETADSADPSVARAKLRGLALHRGRTALVVVLAAVVVTLLLPSLAPYRAAAVVGASGGIFGSFALFFIWSLQGERSFVAAGALQGSQGALRFALVGACAAIGLGSTEMMVGYAILAPAVIGVAGALLLFMRKPRDIESPGLRPTGTPKVDIERRRVVAFIAVFAALLINGDVLLLTTFADQSEVAAYTAAWRFSSGVLLINTALASAFLPFVLAAPDAWVEAKHLVRRGLLVAGGWFALTPLMILIGPLLLGSIGEDARAPMTILLIAFAIDGFYFVLYQVYFRIRRERFLLAAMLLEVMTMLVVTVALRGKGALAPAYGQLAARVVVCGVVVAPLLLSARGRIRWFHDDLPRERVDDA